MERAGGQAVQQRDKHCSGTHYMLSVSEDLFYFKKSCPMGGLTSKHKDTSCLICEEKGCMSLEELQNMNYWLYKDLMDFTTIQISHRPEPGLEINISHTAMVSSLWGGSMITHALMSCLALIMIECQPHATHPPLTHCCSLLCRWEEVFVSPLLLLIISFLSSKTALYGWSTSLSKRKKGGEGGVKVAMTMPA